MHQAVVKALKPKTRPQTQELRLKGPPAVYACIAVCALALADIGVPPRSSTGGPWFCAAQQVVIRCLAAAVTYGAGALPGVSLS